MNKITKNIGGDRLGSGNKMEVDMRTYNRSNHNLDTIVKTTMAPGTLVPFLSLVGQPGDTIDINLDCRIYTHPTVGPLFGSYKVQLDVFTIPYRLYMPKLHNNTLKAGLKMSDIKIPQIRMIANVQDQLWEGDRDNSQINPSCIYKYLGISGLALGFAPGQLYAQRDFNAVPLLGYWDTYKNYYANKQEEIGAVIHNPGTPPQGDIITIDISGGAGFAELPKEPDFIAYIIDSTTQININWEGSTTALTSNLQIRVNGEWIPAETLFPFWAAGNPINMNTPNATYIGQNMEMWSYIINPDPSKNKPTVHTFDLANLDTMREQLLADVMSPTAYIIDENEIEPYNLPLIWNGTPGQDDASYAKMTNLEGLALKTYQADMFNNWMNTDWIDGPTGISAMTAVSTAGNEFTIDALTLQKNLWVLLNRVALSDGTYNSWIETVYTKGGMWRAEIPVYEGGLSKELVFEEVISNSQSGTQPLGTLAGRGTLGKKHKGGHVIIKPDEMVQVMGIISLTPRVDYSQGNTWDVNLKTMDDFHKPQLDGIGYQDLITDAMAWWDTDIDNTTGEMIFKSAGKQPAWLNYMTNVNRTYGNFAVETNEMFMTLNRRYESELQAIKDLTTYIDPSKYNYVFADTRLDAQNFWVQIGADVRMRRVMSAKIIPNL